VTVNPKLFWLFFFSVFLPTSVGLSLGPLRLSVYRVTLIIFFLITAKGIAQACKPTKSNPNFYLMAYACWAFLALVVNHGLGSVVETGGVYLLETVGPYLLIIAYCRDVKRLKQVVNTYLLLVCLSLLITIPETLTNINWLKELLRPVFPSGHASIEKRLGLYRASGSFDHPILQGVVASTAVGLAWFYGGMKRFILVVAAAVTSVSSGAIVAIYIQALFIGWDKITRSIHNRWWIMLALFVTIYIGIDVLSNRSALKAILGNITMSPHTAYWRITIWEFGLDNAYRNPIFGLGLGDWDRPSWMHSGSMDAFWLVSMVRYGFVGFFLYAASIILVVSRLLRLKVHDPQLLRLRRGWLVGMAGLIIASCTVHLWNNAYVFINMYIGLGAASYIVLKKESSKEKKARKPHTIGDNSSLK